MKKILELFGEPILNGGQESFAINLIQAMEKEKYIFDFLTPYEVKNLEYEKIVRLRGGRVYTLGFEFQHDRIKIWSKLNEFLKINYYDVVHINSGSTLFLSIACFLAKKAGVKKVIVHSHCSGEKENIKHILVKLVSAPIFKIYSDEICACSLDAARWKFPKKLIKKKLVIVKNGINLEKFKYNISERNNMRNQLKIPNEAYVLGHVGRFTSEKNQKYIIKLFKKYLHINKDSYLILIGDGKERALLEQEVIRDDELNDKVIFVGETQNVNKYLQAFDIFLFPSLYEGLGIVAIEAEAAGLPVVASDRVPQDIKISDKVFFLELSENQEKWLEILENERKKIGSRKTQIELVRDAGYSIEYTAQQMKCLFDGGI